MKPNAIANRTFWLMVGWLFVAMPAHAFYDPSLGRWVNRDPLEEDEGMNLYELVENDPIGLFDAYGLRSCASMCADALKDPTVGTGGGGGVICENGKKCACAFGFPEFNNQPGDCPALDDGVKQHEKKHFDEVECPKTCSLNRAPWKPSISDSEREKSECARKKEDIGILDRIAKKEKNPRCKAIEEALKRQAEQFVMDHHCN